jgi:hypothetical protein
MSSSPTDLDGLRQQADNVRKVHEKKNFKKNETRYVWHNEKYINNKITTTINSRSRWEGYLGYLGPKHTKAIVFITLANLHQMPVEI